MDSGWPSFELEFKSKSRDSKVSEEIERFLKYGFNEIDGEVAKLYIGIPNHVSDEDQRIVYKVIVGCKPVDRAAIDIVRLTNELVASLQIWNETVDSNLGVFATLTILDRRLLFVPKEFQKSANMYLPAAQLTLGNVIEHDKFVKHCVLDPEDTKGDFGNVRILKKYYEYDPEAVDACTTPLMVDFEHDRRKMFIRFPTTHRQGERSCEAVYKLELRYSTIKRIMVKWEGVTTEPELTLFFHLETMPLVYKIKFERFEEGGKRKKLDPKRRMFSHGDREKYWKGDYFSDYVESPFLKLTFKPQDAWTWLNILNRLVATTSKPILFRNIVDHPRYRFIVNKSKHQFPHKDYDSRMIEDINADFATMYLLEALGTRGFHVTDQLMLDKEVAKRFKSRIVAVYRENKKLLLDALEKLLAMVDEFMELDPIPDLFEIALKKARDGLLVSTEIDEEQKLKGYVKLRKIIITPCRTVYQAPEMIMGNRVLRIKEDKYTPERFLRVAFRDENFAKVQSMMGKVFIEKFVKKSLVDTKVIGGKEFNYFGSSNSQMREQGCYFIQIKDEKEINRFRQYLGDFDKKSVPKMMARLGQCFTQSCKVGKEVDRNCYDRTPDYVGINNRKKDPPEPFVYSDGNGVMSYAFAEEISKSLNYQDFVPCCFQMRFRGFKGIHVVDPQMDRLNIWGRDNDYFTENRNEYRFMCRPSQEKFRTSQTNCSYEVVKISAPSPVCLNRPFINIIDQVSALQSFACHQKIVNRIFQLLDIQLNNIANSLTDEKWARTKLGEFPRLVMFDVLDNVNLTTEPFFRSLLRTSARCTLKKLREKLQIQIPSSLGRSLLGVVDETGQLQYGQVFVKYTVNILQKRPGPGAAGNVLEGPVLITKNPMVVAGDVRMFTAVDIPSLHHLCDVVVFPRHGPRPHPDEMAGSDLDGDEYSVIWDPGLYLDRNEEAFDYTAPKVDPEPVDDSKVRLQMADFFVKYISQDSIGKIANSFLIKADQLGLNSKVCQSIAKKNMEAVDFPKTGKPPSKLCKGDPSRGIDSEVVRVHPDFMEKPQEATYESPRMNGRLFRRIKAIDSELETSIDEQVNTPVHRDPLIHIDGYDDPLYMKMAADHFRKYIAAMEHQLLQRFGVETEVELFSNSYAAIRKRISEKEMDDMSFFNTQRVIEETLEQIYSNHRRMFFESFGEKFENLTENRYENENRDSKDKRHILRDRCSNASDDLKKLAVAYYATAYDAGHQKYLSFAWLCADVLYRVRLNVISEKRRADPTAQINYYSFDPVSDRLSEHIDVFVNADEIRQVELRNRLEKDKTRSRLKPAILTIEKYCEVYDGLYDWMAFSVKWADKNGILVKTGAPIEKDIMDEDKQDTPVFNYTHICLLIILFGQGKLDLNNTPRFLEEPADLETQEKNQPPSTKWRPGQKVPDPDEIYGFSRLSDAKINNINVEGRVALDGSTFFIELLKNETYKTMTKHNVRALAIHSGCENIFWRQDLTISDDCNADRIIITAVGTVTAVNKLRRYLTPKGYLNSILSDQELTVSLASQVVNKIHRLTRTKEQLDEIKCKVREEPEPLRAPRPSQAMEFVEE
ncbi:unnamed protein product [Bursaphelenchus okinawaensis]|uniref:RNA-directed RNA polymerase n=1 Tax=Bursaphelenchus okinawaensis TaxID=465554 RepID=A0A811KRC0_9BILA|nr:unnamed protein product [Bursaphelenchus okinawaensis]CAG9109988.1 unnamed protein product [Bursaphelenchus okinawaensis]